MQHCSLYGDVRQFNSRVCASQHQSAPAHVAAADEIGGKHKTLTKDFQKRLCVFSARDAAEQHVQARWAGVLIQQFRSARKSISINVIAFIDRDIRNRAELLDRDGRIRRNEASARHNDDRGRNAGRSGGKGFRIGDLASKIQTTNETVDLAKGSAALAQLHSQIEACLVAEQHVISRTTGLGGREQEDLVGRGHC